MIFFDESFEWRFKVGCKEERDGVIFWKILEVVSNLDVVSILERGMKVLEQDEVNEEEFFCFETKVEGFHILKKDMKIFEVESNLEDVRWSNFILNGTDYWWNLLLGRSDACDSVLEAKLKALKLMQRRSTKNSKNQPLKVKVLFRPYD